MSFGVSYHLLNPFICFISKIRDTFFLRHTLFNDGTSVCIQYLCNFRYKFILWCGVRTNRNRNYFFIASSLFVIVLNT